MGEGDGTADVWSESASSEKNLVWLTYCSYCKNSFTALMSAGLSGVINDGINVCPKEFDKTVVFPAKSGKMQPVFS